MEEGQSAVIGSHESRLNKYAESDCRRIFSTWDRVLFHF